ncbi:MAG: hypothetical protein V4708_18295 [Bacteroidota bacterium]
MEIQAMAEISISNSDWERLKLKVKRKYNHLSEEDLAYQEGQEEELITRLMTRIKRNREYVVFTLKKGMVHLDTNRL